MAGYTTIEIGGQQVGLRFGVAALRIAAQKNAIKIIDGVLETPDTISTARYMWAAYIDNCYVKEINAEIPFESFVEWAEEQAVGGAAELLRVTKVITDSNFVKPKEKTKEELEKEKRDEESGKKKENQRKSIGTTLKRSA